jgi:capsular polysaccharide biosynthesis protein
MPRGLKHFAMSPTHPHAGKHARIQAPQNAGRAKKSAVVKKFSGCRVWGGFFGSEREYAASHAIILR